MSPFARDDWAKGEVPQGRYAGGGRSPIVWVRLCAGCAGFAPFTDGDYSGQLSGVCCGCGRRSRELHRAARARRTARRWWATPPPLVLSKILRVARTELPVPERREQCYSCGRDGVRGFKVYDADPDGRHPRMALCTGRKACARRAYYLTPPHVRAAQERALEAMA